MKSIWVFLLGTAITLYIIVTDIFTYRMAVANESGAWRKTPSLFYNYTIFWAALILLGLWARTQGRPGLANILVMIPAILVFGIFGFLIVVFNLKSILVILALIATVVALVWYIQFAGKNGPLKRIFDTSRAIAQQRENNKMNMNEGKVSFSQSGGSGQVHYESGEGSFDMYWEFGGGDVVAIINVPTPEHWLARTGIPVERRAAVLDYIGNVTVQKQTKHGSFKLEDSSIVIYDK